MSTATRRATYGKLAGDTTLNSLLAAPPTGYSKSIFYQVVPETAAFPCVVFQRQAGTPTETFGTPSAMEDEIWLFKAIDRASTSDVAESVSARVASLLNDAALSVSGKTLCYLRRQSDVDYSEAVDGVRYVHCGSLYRLVTT